jgi:hypothetical protein
MILCAGLNIYSQIDFMCEMEVYFLNGLELVRPTLYGNLQS